MWRYFSDGPYWFTLSLLAFDWVIRIGLGIRVIMRRNTVGYTLAWLAVILLVPLLGAVIYMLFGERRLGSRRAKRIEELRAPYQAWLHSLAEDFPCEDSGLQPAAVNLRHLARGTVGIPALPGNTLQLLEEQDAFFDSLIADIDGAASSVHLQFYIWQPGGRVNWRPGSGQVDLTGILVVGLGCSLPTLTSSIPLWNVATTPSPSLRTSPGSSKRRSNMP